MKLPLISKPFKSFTPEEFHQHVKDMYELRVKGTKAKKPSFADGLTLSRTKKGLVSIRLNKKKRSFEYVLDMEIDALAKGHGMTKSEVWNAFKAKKFVIAKTRIEAEEIYADIKDIPW